MHPDTPDFPDTWRRHVDANRLLKFLLKKQSGSAGLIFLAVVVKLFDLKIKTVEML